MAIQFKIEPKFRKSDKKTAVLLEMKSWCLLFTDSEIQVLIAEALNTTVVDTKTEIKGYLITSWRVYLILKAKKRRTIEFIHHFEHKVKRKILKELRKKTDKDQVKLFEHKKPHKMFNRLRFNNCEMMDLLEGKTVKLPYYDPGLNRLSEFLENYNFCSVPDYKGNVGPVFVGDINLT